MRAHPFIRAATALALVAALVLVTIGATSAGVSRVWTHQFGRDGTDIAFSVAVDGDRNVFVAGRIATGGGDDCFVRKYLPDGRRRWMRVFGTPAGDYCRGVAIARNGAIYVAGYTSGSLAGSSAGGQDAFVRKYRPDGSVAWTRQFGTSGSEQAYAVAVDDAGNVLVAGHTNGALNGPSRGVWDGFVRKFRADGRHVWTRQFGTAGSDFVTDVAVDPSRRVVMAGETYGSLGAPYGGAGDAFVRVHRPDGDHLWTRQFGTAAQDYAFSLAITDTGRIYAAGGTGAALPGQTSRGGDDAFVRKLKPDGTTAWTRQFGTPGPDWVSAVGVDGKGRVYLAGELYVSSQDAFVMKMLPNGSMVWTRKTGTGTSSEEGRGVAVDHKRHVYLVGMTDGALSGWSSGGGWDAWVRKYKP